MLQIKNNLFVHFYPENCQLIHTSNIHTSKSRCSFTVHFQTTSEALTNTRKESHNSDNFKGKRYEHPVNPALISIFLKFILIDDTDFYVYNQAIPL